MQTLVALLTPQSQLVLLEFLKSFATVMEYQLSGIRESMSEAVGKILECTEMLNSLVDNKKQEAEALLIDSHLNPVAGVTNAIDTAQNEVDKIFSGTNLSDKKASSPSAEIDDQTLLAAKEFNRSLEALSQLARDISIPLVRLMGVLSSEDPISQRLIHVSKVTSAVSLSLGRLLTEIHSAFSREGLLKFQNEVTGAAKENYSLASELPILYLFLHSLREDEMQIRGDGDVMNFLKFLSSFHVMHSRHLSDIREEVTEAVSSSIDLITSMSDLFDKRRSGRTFDSNNPFFSSFRVDPQKLFSDLEEGIRNLVFFMMGELSIDDVVGQRLEHVMEALNALEQLIETIALALNENKEVNVQKLVEHFVHDLQHSYTMPSEQDCHNRAFTAETMKTLLRA